MSDLLNELLRSREMTREDNDLLNELLQSREEGQENCLKRFEKDPIIKEIDFLKLEVHTLKRMFKRVQATGIVKVNSNDEPIVRINKPESVPDTSNLEELEHRKNMGFVLHELKEIFSNGDPKSRLKPIGDVEEIKKTDIKIPKIILSV